jgi:hypothetical protein
MHAINCTQHTTCLVLVRFALDIVIPFFDLRFVSDSLWLMSRTISSKQVPACGFYSPLLIVRPEKQQPVSVGTGVSDRVLRLGKLIDLGCGSRFFSLGWDKGLCPGRPFYLPFPFHICNTYALLGHYFVL